MHPSAVPDCRRANYRHLNPGGAAVLYYIVEDGEVRPGKHARGAFGVVFLHYLVLDAGAASTKQVLYLSAADHVVGRREGVVEGSDVCTHHLHRVLRIAAESGQEQNDYCKYLFHDSSITHSVIFFSALEKWTLGFINAQR